MQNGEPVDSPQWRSARLVVTTKRLVIANDGANQSVPHGNVTIPDDGEQYLPGDASSEATVVLQVGSNVVVVSASDVGDFARRYYRANINRTVVLARHPAVVGGVVQDDAAWSKARITVDSDTLQLAFPGGESMQCELADVGTVERSQGTVMGERRAIVAVEHTDDEDRSVETHLSGTKRHTSVLRTLFESIIDERDEVEYELTEMDNQVLMALYSGVSPFEMSDFLGLPVEDVEEIYQKLLDIGAVDEVRQRTEVTLNAQGRNLASEAMNEQ
jgi:hypothetical protein